MRDIKKVTIVTPEFYGDTMVGGLAVSVHGLAHALKAKGLEVEVVMPAYNTAGSLSQDLSQKEEIQWGHVKEPKIITATKDGIPIHKITGSIIGDITAYGSYPPILEIDEIAYRDMTDRNFDAHHLLSAVIPRIFDNVKLHPDVIHLMEWNTAASAYFLRQNSFSSTPIVVTSHNLQYIGEVPKATALSSKTTLSTSFGDQSPLMKMRQVCLKDNSGNYFESLLELGVHYADVVTTVSPREAEDVINGREGIQPRLRKKLQEKGLVGILNGIDPTIMNPMLDYFIEKYSTKEYSEIERGKRDNKIKLAEELKVPINPDKRLISMMCRLAEQKSIYEVLDSINEINKIENIQLLVIGNPGNNKIAHKIGHLDQYENVFVHGKFAHPRLQHRVLAASNAILQPSKWEPCGYTQLEGMVYGAIPIVTAVGGHRNTVVPFNPENLSGYGIIVENPTSKSIRESIQKAGKLFQNKELWKVAVMNAVNEDFTWSGKRDSVGKYLKVYEQAAQTRAAQK